MATISNGIYADKSGSVGYFKPNSFYLLSSSGQAVGFYHVESKLPDEVIKPLNEESMWLYHAKIFYVRN